MAQRPHAIPKIKCSRTARRTGKKCELWAVPGTVLCWVHGSGGRPGDEGGRTAGGKPRGGPSPQRRRAKTRLVLAELMNGNPRHPWEVVLNAVHIADAVMREAELPIRRGEQLEAGQRDRLMEYSKFAHQLAKTALDVNAHEKIAESFRRDVDLEGGIVAGVLGRVLDALLAALAGPSLALPPERAERLRAWAFGAARDALAALEDPTRPTASVPPPPLDGLALVLTDRPQLEPAASSASSESSSAARWRPAAGRQPDRSADTSAARPARRNGTSARTDDAAEPLDAELVVDDDRDPDEPAATQSHPGSSTDGTDWSDPDRLPAPLARRVERARLHQPLRDDAGGLPNPWRTTDPFERELPD